MIYLVRHGETSWTREGRIQGQTETKLTPKGINQINWLGKYFKLKDIHSIICSELSRSYKTAELINKYHNIPLEINSNINECNWGKWEGLNYSQKSCYVNHSGSLNNGYIKSKKI